MPFTIADKPFHDGTQTPRFAVLNTAGACVGAVTQRHGRAFPVLLGADDMEILRALRAAGKTSVGAWRSMMDARADLAACK